MFFRKYYLALLLTLLYLQPGFGRTVAEEPEVVITLKAVAGLQFDKVRFAVKPGARVKIILTNTDDMSHNMLITQPGTRLAVVNAALKLGAAGTEQNYIPKSEQVLWSIPVLEPGQNKTLSFTAPKSEGIYPYVCTYPGHGFIMFGAMYVTTQALPPIQNDNHVPPTRKNDGTHDDDEHGAHVAATPKPQPLHPYTPVAPYFYRIFMPDASPAAIAVNLPGNISYCWDAGTCHLRYAWQGGFLDNTDHWKGNGNALAKITGQEFYRNKSDFPFRMSQSGKPPKVDFKGYRLVNRYPEFRYTLDDVEVTEFITPKADGTGLIRKFTLKKPGKMTQFITHPTDGVTYTASQGNWENNILKLKKKEAREFTLIMTKQEGAK